MMLSRYAPLAGLFCLFHVKERKDSQTMLQLRSWYRLLVAKLCNQICIVTISALYYSALIFLLCHILLITHATNLQITMNTQCIMNHFFLYVSELHRHSVLEVKR